MRFSIPRVGGQTFIKKVPFSDETCGRIIPKDKKMQFKVSSYRQFQYDKSLEGKVFVRQYIDELVSSFFTLKKYQNLPELPTAKAYPLSLIHI